MSSLCRLLTKVKVENVNNKVIVLQVFNRRNVDDAVQYYCSRNIYMRCVDPVLISCPYNFGAVSQRNISYKMDIKMLSPIIYQSSLTLPLRSFWSYDNICLKCVNNLSCSTFPLMTMRDGKIKCSDIFPIQDNHKSLQYRKFSNSRKLSLRRKRYSEDDGEVEEKPLTVEKQLLNLMEMWKMDEAVELLVESLKTGFTPNGGVILNLLQQLAYLGEVDNILDLHDEFLKDKNVTREDKFYALLTDAYCNSGRVEEGVAMLRIIYHKTRNFDETDSFFTMITIMIIQNFEHHLTLIEDFVTDLMEKDEPEEKAVASLWKCFVLTERFDKADVLLEEHENLAKFIPAQVSSIINAPFYVTYNKDAVLSWLIPIKYIKIPLKAAAMEALIQHKCEEDKLQEALDLLREAMVNDEMLIRQSTLTHFVSSFLSQLPSEEITELEEWAKSLDDGDEEEKDLSDHEDKKSE